MPRPRRHWRSTCCLRSPSDSSCSDRGAHGSPQGRSAGIRRLRGDFWAGRRLRSVPAAGVMLTAMAVVLLREPPLVPPAGLGPYRRRDYESLPDEPRCELIHGRLYSTPSLSPLHQVVAMHLWRLLDDIADASGGLVLAAPLDVVLADHSVVQPDVIYLSAERRELVGKGIEGAPDLLVEVLS